MLTCISPVRAPSADARSQNHIKAQAQLLAKAQNSVFLLETAIKENAPKVERLKDYEKRIEQLTDMETCNT